MSATQPIARLRLVRKVVQPKDEGALFDGDLDDDLDAAFVAAFDDDAAPLPIAEGSGAAMLERIGDELDRAASAIADAESDDDELDRAASPIADAESDDDAPTIRDEPPPGPEAHRRWLAVVRTEVGRPEDREPDPIDPAC